MTAPTRASVGLRSERGPILLSLMLSTSLVALDSTIVATAVPSIVADLGGFSQFPWLFSVYLLAQAVSVPVYGKLADMFGRKPIMLFGIGLFLFGSILCGFAWSMPALIAFRARAGTGRRRGAADERHHRRRHLHPRRTGQGPGLPGQRVGDLRGGRADPGRGVRAVPDLALDLLRQHPAVRAGRLDADPPVPRVGHAASGTGSTTWAASASPSGCTLLILGLLEGGQAWAWDSAASIARAGRRAPC